jgi:hypothetical protein
MSSMRIETTPVSVPYDNRLKSRLTASGGMYMMAHHGPSWPKVYNIVVNHHLDGGKTNGGKNVTVTLASKGLIFFCLFY